MQQITKSSKALTKKNIINRISDIPGGVSLDLSTLVAGNYIPEATPLAAPASGKRKICKQAKILAGSTTTAIKVDELTHNFKVGDIIGVLLDGKASAITGITNSEGVDTIAVGSAIDTPVQGDFIYEMAAAATGLDASLNIAYDNDTCSGLTADATSDALTVGGKQGTAATIVGTIASDGAGNAEVTVSSDLFDDEVLSVAVAKDDTHLIVASKMRQALLENETITSFFEVMGEQDQVILVLKSVVNGAALKNEADVILKEAFQVPSATQVIWMKDAFVRADVVEGCIGSLYLATLDVKEVKY